MAEEKEGEEETLPTARLCNGKKKVDKKRRVHKIRSFSSSNMSGGGGKEQGILPEEKTGFGKRICAGSLHAALLHRHGRGGKKKKEGGEGLSQPSRHNRQQREKSKTGKETRMCSCFGSGRREKIPRPKRTKKENWTKTKKRKKKKKKKTKPKNNRKRNVSAANGVVRSCMRILRTVWGKRFFARGFPYSLGKGGLEAGSGYMERCDKHLRRESVAVIPQGWGNVLVIGRV